MKRLAASTALAAFLSLVALVPVAQADPSEYGIKSASATASTIQAGGHPDFTTSFELKTEGEEGKALPSTTLSATFELPAGLLGNPRAVPTCSAAQLIGTDPEVKSNKNGCPIESQIGITKVRLFKNGSLVGFTEPLFNMAPGPGEPARLGFFADVYPVFVEAEVQPEREYAATATVEGASSLIPLLSAETTIWGVPADESHDGERLTAYEAVHKGIETESGERPSNLVPVPFMINPVRCGVAQGVGITAVPYLLPELRAEAFAPLAPNAGCDKLEFKPSLSLTPTSEATRSASGLDAELTFPTDGFEHENLRAPDDQKRVEVTLPEGVTVNPSQANGLGACSEAQFAREAADSAAGQGCPESSKVGSLTATSPLVEEEAEGAIYVAAPYANPFDSLIAIYMVLRIPERGVIVKLPGKVSLDPQSGQLLTIFGEGAYPIPQLPVSAFHLHFRAGPRAPLITPARCSTYEASARFESWGGHVATLRPSFAISRGAGGPCPSGAAPFDPGFDAGSSSNLAAAFSPFHMRITRHDEDQELTRFSSKLPAGLLAKLTGVSYCPDRAIEAARARSGLAEQASPSCPASSQIGSLSAGAGVGEVLTYAAGKLYLAGPFQGAPLSVAAIAPAVAGPFDLGTVVTREPLRVDPETAEVEADGVSADPIPHILAGVPLRVRDVRVDVDRPDFALNPTNCDPLATGARMWGAGPDPFDPADDVPVSRSAPFQVANCSLLGFKPKLSLRLRGAMKRGGNPALSATLKMPAGGANIAHARVALPRSEFVDNAHFRTICTRVQFAAAQCPPGAIYGFAKAITPLLDQPLEGPVYLRSSSHKLPDLVADLNGQIHVVLDGRIDSVHGGGIRNTFEVVPDAPVSSFTLTMQGGQKGLLENSTDLCAATHRAKATFVGQNGKVAVSRPLLRVGCGKGASRGGGGRRGLGRGG